MSALIADLRDGIVTDFNAAGVAYFGTSFTADAKWFDQSDNTDEALGVHVIGDGQRTTRLARDRQQIDLDVIVHVVKKLSGDATAEVDALALLLERCERFYYATARVSTIAADLSASSLQLPSRKMLNKSRRFYGWARLTFQTIWKT